jgi:hypothetical protein
MTDRRCGDVAAVLPRVYNVRQMKSGLFPNTPMPGNVKAALTKGNLLDAYLARPEYQRIEYLKWIAAANGAPAKQKLLDQMLAELESGKLYKGEAWAPPAPIKK